ncbi:hypothetical protein DBA29_22380 [Xenophilus aerolatus]|nr:hypothetical protein [Xenophilus aerolatus]
MSRPDLYPHERDEWVSTSYAPLRADPELPRESVLGRLRANHDTLAQRTRATVGAQGTTPRRGLVVFVAIVAAVLLLAGLRAQSPHFAEPTAPAAPTAASKG